jgi:hypothetical protein
LTVAARVHEGGLPQLPQVIARVRNSESGLISQGVHWLLALGQEVEEQEPGRAGQYLADPSELLEQTGSWDHRKGPLGAPENSGVQQPLK